MRVTKKDGTDERLIITAMITDSIVLGRIADKWTKQGLCQSKWANLVGGWCVEFFGKYEEAPKGNIESIFKTWAEASEDATTVELVEKFIGSISDDYEAKEKSSKSEYVLDQAGKHFNIVRAIRIKEKLERAIELGQDKDIDGILNEEYKIELGPGSIINVIDDKEAVKQAFSELQKPVIEYSGDFGRFINPYLTRDSFVCFMGQNKVGKSWHLMDMAWRALKQKVNTIFFQIGDMSQDQVMRRLGSRSAQQPEKACPIAQISSGTLQTP